jgi:hypothetical protein
MHILRTLLVAAGVALFACSARADANKSEGFGELTIDQVSDLIAKHEADVFDNNGKDEWASGHVPTAKWVQFNDVKASDLPQDHARKLVFYCHNRH